MADRQTTGAVHITELGVNIQPAIDSLNELKSQIENFSSQMEQNPVILPIGGDVDSANEKVQKLDASMRQFFSTQKQIETLNTSWRNFLSQVERVDVSTQGYTEFRAKVQESAKSMLDLAENVRKSDVITAKQIEDFRQLAIALQRYKGEFADFKNPNAQIQALSKEIENTVKQLDRLSSKTIKSSSLSEISNLKNEYQALNEQIKNGSVSAEDAQVQMQELNQRFNDLSERIRIGDGVLNNFFTRLGNRVAWMAAMSLVNLVRQAFSNFIGTIKDTEDAVIEVQRVLGDTAVTNEQVSQTLYDIAYEYGQTFENVQDAFVKFVQTGMDFQNATEAVRATMLALNTAELEVSEATTGLIAVISQFGYEGSDLEAIIDKINITADNFAVTSEKIVSALQRAGGTAKAFGMTLDETIAVITALSEATGRAGANIGTALNSLIIFTQKDDALKKFSEFLGQDVSNMPILDLWDELSKKVGENKDELAAWMAQSEEASELFTEDMAEVIGATDEYYASLEAANRGALSAAGAWRQNYFIALLENWKRVQDVLDTMNESAGYSTTENEKAMERLTARVNQLIVAAKELAVQFGEAGFLDLLKMLTQAGTAVLKFTKDVGGLSTVLSMLIGIMLQVKAASIVKVFKSWGDGIKNFADGIKVAITGLRGYVTGTEAATVSTEAFGLAVQGTLGIIGILITAVTAVVGAYKGYKQAQEEARQATIDAGLEAQSTTQNLEQLKSEWDELNSQYQKTGVMTDELTQKSEQLRDALREQGYYAEGNSSAYQQLAGDMGALSAAMQAVIEKQHTLTKAAAEAAGQEFVEAFTDKINELQNEQRRWESGSDVSRWKEYFDFKGWDFDISNAEKAIETLNHLEELRKTILTEGYDGDLQAAEMDSNYESLSLFISAMEEAGGEYQSLTEQAKAYADALDEGNASQENASGTAKDFTEDIKAVGDKIDEVTGKISDFESSWDSLIGVVNDYNESGEMTAEMVQKLLELEPEYLAVLEEKNGKLSINEQQAQSLIGTNEAYLQQLAALRTAEEIETLATELQAAAKNHLTIEEVKSKIANQEFGDTVYTAALQMIQGKITAEEFAATIQNVGIQAGISGQYLSFFGAQSQSILQTYKDLLSRPISYSMPSVSVPKTSGGSGSGSGSGESAAKKALQAEIKAWQQREKDVKDYYKKLKETTEDYYDGLIEQLEDVEEANDRINKQLDYYNNRQEALRGLEQARSRSGVEAREKEVEYQQKLIELDDDWRKTQSDWDIEDRIDQLKEMKEIAVEQIEDALEAATKAIEETIEKLQEKVNNMSTSTGKSVASGISSGISTGVSIGQNTFDEMFKNVQGQEDELAKKTEARWVVENRKQEQMREQIRLNIEEEEAYGQQMLDQLQYLIDHNMEISDRFRDILVNALPSAAAESAKKMLYEYDTKFAKPLKESIANAMADMQLPAKLSGPAALAAHNYGLSPYAVNPTTTNNISMFANVNGAAGANAAQQLLNGSNLRASRF